MSQRTLAIHQLIEEILLQIPFKGEIKALKNHTFPYMRIEIPIPSLDLLSWLQAQSVFPKIYFETPKSGIQVAGIGAAFVLDEIPCFHHLTRISHQLQKNLHNLFSDASKNLPWKGLQTLPAKDCSTPQKTVCTPFPRVGEKYRLSTTPRFFGGMDFFERKANTWGNFPSCRYILPLIEMEVREAITYFCFNRVQEDLPLETIRSLNFTPDPLNPFESKPYGRFDAPSFPVWDHNIRESLLDIHHDKFDKIVLARASLFHFEKSLSPLAICKSLQGKSLTATLFAFQFSSSQAFVGATPESLYKRKHRQIETAAIAGTRPRGASEKEDRALRDELLGNEKEMHEFNVVREEIEKQLQPLCSSLLKQSDNRIIQTSTVQHIYHPFKGCLKESIDDEILIRALHPTPAVGGHPKEIAMEEIRKKETFDRGWYAAPIGWISPENAHLLVAIRSALIQENQLQLFAGTGIILGSTSHREWEELEHKISQFLTWE